MPGLLALACAATAAETTTRFAIPAQAAPAALRQFSDQARAEVLYSASELETVRTGGIDAETTPLDALLLLLSGTGFGARQTGPARFVVVANNGLPTGSIEGVVRGAESGQGIENARVEAAGTGRTTQADPRGRFLLTGVPTGIHTLVVTARGSSPARLTEVRVDEGRRTALSPIDLANEAARSPEAASSGPRELRAETVVSLESFEVNDARPKPFTTANLDLPRMRDDALPFLKFSGAEIQASGAPSLQEFLQTRLVQNFNADIPSELDGLGNNQTARLNRVNLRGWGETETVFLLNGRRMVPQYQGTQLDTSNATPNLQGIPIGSVERIEILSSAGGAIYGANATGGVINIITRMDYHGGQISLNFESPADTFAPRRGVDLTYNRPLGENMTLRVSAGYSASDPLRSIDRADDTILRWRRLVLERQPERLQGRTSPVPVGTTPNIRTVATTAAANLFGPGTANLTSVPEGYTGGGTAAAFTPGVYNLGLAEGASGLILAAKESTLGIETEDKVFNLGVDRRLNEDWRLSVDYRYSENDGKGRTPASLSFSLPALNSSRPQVPATAPGNPFGQTVLVHLVDPGLQRPELNNRPVNIIYEITTTLRGRIGEWRGYADFNYSHNRSLITSQLFSEPYGGWRAALLSGAYDPFVDLRFASPAEPSFYENYIAERTSFESATHHYQAGLKASGPLIELPAGLVELTAGFEWTRSNRYLSRSVGRFQDNITGEARIPTSSTSEFSIAPNEALLRRFVFDSYAVYSEATIPLLGERRRLPLVHDLEFSLAGRISDEERNGFNTAGVPVEYTATPSLYSVGLKHSLLPGATIRASRSIGFRPPGVAQVSAANPPINNLAVTDRVRNQAVSLAPTQYITGGNPDLEPEDTRSDNVGVILSPPAWAGFRLSADLVTSRRDNAIAAITAQQVLDLEADLPGRVQRAAPDGHPSGAGPLAFVDARNLNFRQIRSRSLDLSVEQVLRDVRGGDLHLSLTGTRNLSFKVQSTNTTPAVEQVGNADAAAARQIKWNANAQARWEGRRWTFGWTVRYFDKLLVAPADILLQGDDVAGRAYNHDVFVLHRLKPRGDSGWARLVDDTTITVGIKNLFDRRPRFWAADTDRGIAPYDSVAGRTIWMQLRRNF